MDERLCELADEEQRILVKCQRIGREIGRLTSAVYETEEEAERAEAEVTALERQEDDLQRRLARVRYALGEYPSAQVRAARAAARQG